VSVCVCVRACLCVCVCACVRGCEACPTINVYIHTGMHAGMRYAYISSYLPTYALEVSMMASRPALDNREPVGKQEVRLGQTDRCTYRLDRKVDAYTGVCVCVCVCLHVCVCVCVNPRQSKSCETCPIKMYTYKHACRRAYIHINLHTYLPTYALEIHTYQPAYLSTYIRARGVYGGLSPRAG